MRLSIWGFWRYKIVFYSLFHGKISLEELNLSLDVLLKGDIWI